MARRANRPEWNRRKPTLREATLTTQEDAGEGVRRLVLSLPRWEGDDPRPGQFLMLRVSETGDPLLHRPLGFSSFRRRGLVAEVEVWVRLAGRGTALVSRWAVGDRVSFVGPLGNGFPLPAPGERPVLVAGGIGVPPILFLARALAARGEGKGKGEGEGEGEGKGAAGERPLVLYGGPSRRALQAADPLSETGAELALITEDGSSGEKGLVTDLLAGRDLARSRLYACGPAPMLAAVRRAAMGRCLGLHLSLEARMACGFGVCSGCAVQAAPAPGEGGEGPRYLRVCKDGPVFDAEALTEESFGPGPGGGSPGGGKGCQG